MFGMYLSTVIGEPFGVETSTAKLSSECGLSACANATESCICSPTSKMGLSFWLTFQ